MKRRTRRGRAFARPWLAALLACAAGAAAHGAQSAASPASSPRTLSQLHWNQDGSALVGVADEGSREAAFQAYDGSTGKPLWRLELDRLRDPRRGRTLSVDRWQPSTLPGELLVESGGDLFVARAGGTAVVTQLTQTKSVESDATLSPDGGRVAYVRDGDLWAIELDGGRERRLTDDGRPPAIVNGARPEPPVEPFDRGAPFAWAADGRTLAFLRRDATGVRLRLVSTITPGFLEVETGAPAEGSLEEIEWRFDVRALAVERRSADGRRLDLLLCHAEKLYCRKLASRPTEAAGERRREIRFLATGFVWSSTRPQRDGLALFDTVGRERELFATGEWEPERVESADESLGVLLLRASRATAGGSRESGLVRVSFRPGVAPVLLASGDEHKVVVSPAGNAFVAESGGSAATRRRELRGVDGRTIAVLPPAPAGK